MSFPRQPRRVERQGWEDAVRINALENDADQNDRNHDTILENLERQFRELRTSTKNAADDLKKVHTEEYDDLRGRVDRLSWALATAAVSFALMALSIVVTQAL